MYDFDRVIDRTGTGSIKWEKQNGFGVKSGLLPFWIADTDFATTPEIVEALAARVQHPMCGYSEVTESCLEAIQGWYNRRHHWMIPTEAMLIGTSVVTSMRYIIGAVTAPLDKVMIFTPVYDPFFAIVENSGRTLVTCPLTHEDNTYNLNFELMEEEIKNGVKLIVFCNPHNPLGRVWSYADLERLANLCVKYDVYLISDEIHGDIVFGKEGYTTMGRFPQVYPKLAVMTAISKTFNMAGLSSCCMMIPNLDFKKLVDDAVSASWIFTCNGLAYTAIEAAYTYGDRWVDEQNEYLQANARYVTEYFAEHLPTVPVNKQQGTFLMWLDFRTLGMSSDELTALMAKEYKLALGNGGHYGKEAEGFMRLNIGCPRATLQKGLELLGKLYDDVKH